MEASILTSTKKILGIAESLTVFDLDVITHINSAFMVLAQIGVGPEDGFMIEDAEAVWEDFIGEDIPLNLVRTYIFLKVRILFDPPNTGYLVTAMEKQIGEAEWRLNVYKDTKEVTTDDRRRADCDEPQWC